MNEIGESFQKQLDYGGLVMHRTTKDSQFIFANIFLNRHTAGPLFYIDRKFFEGVGGYVQTQLYGNDDGELCKIAHKKNRFIGIVTDVEVLHLKDDSCDGYAEWKRRNIKGNVDRKGYWD
jgi:hypothetical protein